MLLFKIVGGGGGGGVGLIIFLLPSKTQYYPSKTRVFPVKPTGLGNTHKTRVFANLEAQAIITHQTRKVVTIVTIGTKGRPAKSECAMLSCSKSSTICVEICTGRFYYSDSGEGYGTKFSTPSI